MTPGQKFRKAIESEHPLQIVGAINAYAALMAQRAGFRALYLSGAGVANASFGLPDLAITTLNDVAEDARRIAARVDLLHEIVRSQSIVLGADRHEGTSCQRSE